VPNGLQVLGAGGFFKRPEEVTQNLLFAPEEPTQGVVGTPSIPRHVLDIDTIYHEPRVEEFARGREILARFPEARRIEVPSHWSIPELHGNEGSARDWLKVKKSTLVVGVKKGMTFLPYTRSCDWVAPSHSNGCALACAYCYVPRRKGFANPISTFVNIEQIQRAIARHVEKAGRKASPTTADDDKWIYELGCNSDASLDAAVCDNIKDLIALFRSFPHARATFATKFVNRDLLGYDPQRRTRLRFSLMPPRMSRLVDVRTSPIVQRIAAIDDFYEAGYEVNLNFAPVIFQEGWQDEWRELFRRIDGSISAPVRAQLACEIIFLTHNAALHRVNQQWHPRAENVLWRADLQETKISEGGMENLRYKRGFKGELVARFQDILREEMPYCRVRYAF
jgi:spore photoproduct lyase